LADPGEVFIFAEDQYFVRLVHVAQNPNSPGAICFPQAASLVEDCLPRFIILKIDSDDYVYHGQLLPVVSEV
jgi:hypothetical protein